MSKGLSAILLYITIKYGRFGKRILYAVYVTAYVDVSKQYMTAKCESRLHLGKQNLNLFVESQLNYTNEFNRSSEKEDSGCILSGVSLPGSSSVEIISPNSKLKLIMDSIDKVLKSQLSKTLQHMLTFMHMSITSKDQQSGVRNKTYNSTFSSISS